VLPVTEGASSPSVEPLSVIQRAPPDAGEAIQVTKSGSLDANGME